MGSRAQEKLEKRLKELLREPANKRCINCESLGPQYVVSNFNVFVCTVCSGVHRQFGHRVKGVSMSTFKPEEVQALAESGNAKFVAYYLHKWQPGAAPKPVDRDVHRIHAWIAAAYQDRRWFAEPAGGWAPGASGTAAHKGSTTSTEGHEHVVKQMSDVLGSDTPKLKVQGSSNLERSISAVSSSAGPAAPANGSAAAVAQPAVVRGLNLLDVASSKSAKAAAPAAEAAWDPFGAAEAAAAPSSSPAAAAAGTPSPRRGTAPAAEAGWAAFGDAPVAPAAAASPPAAPAPASPAAAGAGGWEAFGDTPAAPSAAAPAAAPAAVAPAASSGAGTAPSSIGSSPPKVPPQPRRAEVPMDVFYPEFEQIRATGMLPTGKPVPLQPFPHGYGPAGAGPPQHPHAYGAPYGHPSQPQYQHQQPAAYGSGVYGGASRPTIAIPPAPQYPGYPYAGGSPAAGGHPLPSPGAYSAYSPAGSAPSPAGSGFSSALLQPTANGSFGSFTGLEQQGAGVLRSSTGSLPEMLPAGLAAPTPAAHRLGDPSANDPFAGLAPGLRGALPAVPSHQDGTFKAGGSAPPPTPAGGPPFGAAQAANCGAAAYMGAGPFAGAPSPAAGLAPATAAATATLYGRTPSLTGYDLGAPSAPKPQASGNPFA